MDMSTCFIWGERWIVLALVGIRRFNIAWCVEFIRPPSGSMTVFVLVVGVILVLEVWRGAKYPVVPMSMIAVLIFWEGVAWLLCGSLVSNFVGW